MIFKSLHLVAFVSSNWRRSVLLLTAILLFLLPTLLWKNYGYFVGGDDSLLHYMYPGEMIQNFALNIVTNNTLSGPKEYIERLHLLPLLGLIWIVNALTGVSNSLYIFLGFILSAGFLSFYHFLKELQDQEHSSLFVEKFGISLFYVFSVHHYLSVMNYKLVVMYIVFLFPFVLMLFTKAVLKKQPLYLVPASIVASVFSVVLIGIPWLFAYVISAGGVFMYLFFKHPMRFFDYAIRLILLLLGMNFYWMFHFIYAIVSNTAVTNGYSGILTPEFRQRNIDAILSVTHANSIFDSFLGFFHPNLQNNFQWPTAVIQNGWHSQFVLLNILIFSFVILSIFFYKQKRKIDLFPFAVIGWLVTLYFFTVNMIGFYGIRLFLFFNENVPGFSMFRNNYDKFASGMAFSLALLFFAVATEIHHNSGFGRVLKKTWLLTLLLFITVTILPVVQGGYERDIFITTSQTRASIEGLDARFIEFTKQLDVVEYKTLLWMPLSKASYITISDNNNPDYVFSGISPLIFLSNVHDYAGVLSFRTRESTILSSALAQQDAVAFGNFLKELGITHIAVNNTISEDMRKSYVYGEDFIAQQSPEFMSEFLGEKIISVDDAFVLYKVNDTYYQEDFYFKDNCQVTEYSRTERDRYLVKVSNNDNDINECTLIFKQPFHKLWTLHSSQGEKESTPSQEFQNSWIIDAESDEVIVSFKPRDYVQPLIIFSGIVTIVSLIYFIVRTLQHD